jgi:DNA processing protein
MDHDRRRHLLALCAVRDANWHVIAREASKPGGLERLLEMEFAEGSDDARKTRRALRTAFSDLVPYLERADEEIARADEVGARLVTVLDDDYPANLRVIWNLPPFLFYRGDLERDDARSVAIVGTRKASEEGIKRARQLARDLAGDGVTVTSGMALGIDAAAHEATLEAGGRTIAVLGTGILRTYPKEHVDLAERIAAAGALVSQFWPSQAPTKYTFPRRNVVTSGMSQGTAVIEASSTSGAKMQARLAHEHGKQVFLLRTLVTDQPWARKYVEQGKAVEVPDTDTILRALRSPDQMEEISAGRRQLTIAL